MALKDGLLGHRLRLPRAPHQVRDPCHDYLVILILATKNYPYVWKEMTWSWSRRSQNLSPAL